MKKGVSYTQITLFLPGKITISNIFSDLYRKKALIAFFVIFISGITSAQTKKYNQLGNELQFSRALNDKWAAETYLGGTFSETETEEKVLKTNIQRYIYLWGHYYLNPRWKLSGSLAYFYNKDVPDIGQYFSPEYRLTLQGTYYIHKTGYTLFTRMRGELRYMMNADGVFEDKYRYRQMLKFMKPLNSNVLRQGVFYFLTTEELFFKPKAKSSGITFLDRNRFEIGGGYLITDNLQLEMTYVNEFLPRDTNNEMYNLLAVTLTVNNLFPRLKDKLIPKPVKTTEKE